MDKKRQKEYIDFRYHNEIEKYMEKGYISSDKVLDDHNKIFQQTDILEDNPIGETSEEYLRRTIEYCQTKDIPITLFVSPIYELQLISTENYDNYVGQVRTIADEYGVEFYDFNLAKKEYLPIQQGDCFMDIGHLNDAGADMLTPFFYEVVSGGKSDNDRYFYDSYAEKIQNASPETYGIYYRNIMDEGKAMRTFRVASSRDMGMEYRITISPNEGDGYVIQDFDENKEFTISANETGICTIEARMKETQDDVGTLEINLP